MENKAKSNQNERKIVTKKISMIIQTIKDYELGLKRINMSVEEWGKS